EAEILSIRSTSRAATEGAAAAADDTIRKADSACGLDASPHLLGQPTCATYRSIRRETSASSIRSPRWMATSTSSLTPVFKAFSAAGISARAASKSDAQACDASHRIGATHAATTVRLARR